MIMSPITGWLCTSNSKRMFVKIIHPGGHVELHDRPISAAELLNRNPRCCVAHPTVFQQPHAIISPETILVLGQKYYVVPLGTIRKLQLRYRPSVLQGNRQANPESSDYQDETDSACWLMRSKSKNGKKAKGKNGCVRMSGRIKFRASSGSDTSKDSHDNKADKHKKRTKKDFERVENGEASPGRLTLTSVDNWQPGLNSITEE